jgi:hypothetical protein
MGTAMTEILMMTTVLGTVTLALRAVKGKWMPLPGRSKRDR